NIESGLASSGTQFEIASTSECALAAMTAAHPPDLVLLDVNVAQGERGVPIGQMLAAAHAFAGHRCPTILIADVFTEEWSSLLAESIIDDVVSSATPLAFWRIRTETVLRNFHLKRELERLQQTSALDEHRDALTGAYNRATMLSMLFRETDRVQRMKTSLSLILFEIDNIEFESEQHVGKHRDDVLCSVVDGTVRLLRSYDLLSRVGNDQFLLALPGCDSFNALCLAERLSTDVFATPFQALGETMLFSASFGIASSQGRSPLVVLREAEQALQSAKAAGSGRIH